MEYPDLMSCLKMNAFHSQLTLIGIDGIPNLNKEATGNIISPYITLRYSLRTSPTLDVD